ncbi:hypothetical protein [Actinomadura opuntiae]|uniref:hypothetical protein n=1 Tax=Actinomadura sp. OS1-43 TaxID=604315 RepID=UPI00255B3506|nr:hypothetical protein [Actinomadura sp. OS1-43]MDL4818633.1 hypothetical protein [Actinomadura sp. OS1-43]
MAQLVEAGSLTVAVPGTRVIETTCEAQEIDEQGIEVGPLFDFTALFPLCRCGDEACESCSGFQLTPRTVAALHAVGEILADEAFNDVEEHGDDPLLDSNEWAVFG